MSKSLVLVALFALIVAVFAQDVGMPTGDVPLNREGVLRVLYCVQ